MQQIQPTLPKAFPAHMGNHRENCLLTVRVLTILSQLWAREEATPDMTHIAHISPVAWQHINFYGRYEFTKAPEPINMEEIVEALAHHPILSMVDEGNV